MIIEFEGQKHQFPDDFTDDDIASALGPAKPKAVPVDPVVDALKTAPGAVAKGFLGLADIPRMIESGLDAGNEYLVSKGLATPRDRTPVAPMPPTSQELQKNVEQYTGEFHKPQTSAGEWVDYVGGFAPGIIGGPGGLLMRAGTQVLAPALASEGAGQLAKGTQFETPARVAGAVLGGPAASRVATARAAAPTVEALKDASSTVFRNPAIRGTAIPKADIRATGNSTVMRLSDDGFNAVDQPAVFRQVARLDSASTVGEIHNVRKALNKVEQGSIVSNPAQAQAARVAKGEMDRLLDAVSPQIRGANQNYGAGMRGQRIAEALEKADNNAGAANSGLNTNADRQALKSILNSKKERAGFSKAELAQLKTVVKGTRTGNAARRVGNFLGGGGGLGQMTTATLLGGGGGYAAGGAEGAGTGAILALLLGRGAKGIEAASTRRQAAKLSEMVRGRSPLGRSNRLPTVKSSTLELARALSRGNLANNSSDRNR